MSLTRKAAWLTSSSVLLSALVTPAFAQTSEAEPVQFAQVADEIIVTGQKIERTLFETKESVALITDVQIEDLGLLDLEDAYLAAANVFTLSNGENFGIRGITQNSSSTGGGDGELGSFYIDGVAYTGFATRFGPRDLWDVEQIEILRGPQSTNVGRNALIGAVVIQTKDPNPDGFEATVRGQVGNYDTYSAEGMLNIPLTENSALRLTGEYFESDGFIENVTRNEDYDPRENALLRAKYLFEPTDALSINLTAQYSETSRGWDVYRADLTGEESLQSSANLPGIEDYEGYALAADVSYQINDLWSVQSITSYLSGDYLRFNDDDNGPEGGTAFRDREVEDENIAQELRFTYESDRLRGVIGGYYTEVDPFNDTGGLVSILPANVGVPNSLLPFYPAEVLINTNFTFDGTSTNYALFSEFEYDLTDRLSLSAGLRYDFEDQVSNTENNLTLDPTTPLPDPAAVAGTFPAGTPDALIQQVVGGITQVNAVLNAQLTPAVSPELENDFEAFLPKVGLTYDATDTVSLSAFYARGYRAGGVQLNVTGVIDEYEPEYLDNFEVAFRSTHLDGALTLLANAYYGLWTDQQVGVPQDGNIFNIDIQNAGESTIYGLEFEAQYSPNDQLSLFGSLGFAQTEFDEFCRTGGAALDFRPDCTVNGLTGEDLAGGDFAFSPDVTVSLGGRYTFENNFFVSGNITHQSSAFSDIDNTPSFEVDGFTLANGSIGYRADDWEISAYGRNLFNEFYLNFRGPGIGADQLLVTAGTPREYGVTFSKRFG